MYFLNVGVNGLQVVVWDFESRTLSRTSLGSCVYPSMAHGFKGLICVVCVASNIVVYKQWGTLSVVAALPTWSCFPIVDSFCPAGNVYGRHKTCDHVSQLLTRFAPQATFMAGTKHVIMFPNCWLALPRRQRLWRHKTCDHVSQLLTRLWRYKTCFWTTSETFLVFGQRATMVPRSATDGQTS